MSLKTNAGMRPQSSIVVDGVSRAPSRPMHDPAGFKESDFSAASRGGVTDSDL